MKINQHVSFTASGYLLALSLLMGRNGRPCQIWADAPYMEQLMAQKVSYFLAPRVRRAYNKQHQKNPQKAYEALKIYWENEKKAQFEKITTYEMAAILAATAYMVIWAVLTYGVVYKRFFSGEDQMVFSYAGLQIKLPTWKRIVSKAISVFGFLKKIEALYTSYVRPNPKLETIIGGTAVFLVWSLGMQPILYIKPVPAWRHIKKTLSVPSPPGLGLSYYYNLMLTLVLDYLIKKMMRSLQKSIYWINYYAHLFVFLLKFKYNNALQSLATPPPLLQAELAYLIQQPYLSDPLKKNIEGHLRMAQGVAPSNRPFYLDKVHAYLVLPNRRQFKVAVNKPFLIQALQNYGNIKATTEEDLNETQRILYAEVEKQAQRLQERHTASGEGAPEALQPRRYSLCLSPTEFTGKKYFISQILPRAIEVTDQNTQQVHQLSVVRCDVVDFLEPSSKEAPGAFLQKMLQHYPKGYDRPMVLSITNLHKLKESPQQKQALYAFFSRAEPSYYDQWLDQSIPLPAIILFTARQPVVMASEQELFDSVVFPGFSKDAKKRIFLEQILPELMDKYGIEESPKTYFTQAEYAHIAQMPDQDGDKNVKPLYDRAEQYIESTKLLKETAG